MTRLRFAAAVIALIPVAVESAAPAVLTDGQRLAATELVAYDSSEAVRAVTLRVEEQDRDSDALVRWGEPRPLRRRPAIVLADGSWLLADRTWSPGGLVRIDADQVKLRRGVGWLAFDRDAVRWVVLDAEAAGLRVESLDLEPAAEDAVLLVAGDRLTGDIQSLDRDSLTLQSGEAPIKTAPDEVAAMRLAGPARVGAESPCLVGLSDGSLFRPERLTVSEENYTATLAGVQVTGSLPSLALVQPLGGRVAYLSDLEPIDYRHTPYLDLAWPYARDRGLRGGLLNGGDAMRAKGLATHSAARLIYRLDVAAQRFQASLAVADPPAESTAEGSVVFRVYLVKEGAFESAYESPIVRAGDPATPIDIDATGAAGLALVVDYADRGDAGDEALWLDARLVRDTP